MKQYSALPLVIIACLTIGATGCGKSSVAPTATPPATTAAGGGPGAATANETVLTAWGKGDKSTAVKSVLEADWAVRPLFTSGTTLALSDKQFSELSASARSSNQAPVAAAMTTLKEVAIDVRDAGRDAAAKGDVALARKHFMALQHWGEALAGPDSMAIIGIVGRGIKKIGDTELAGLPQ